MEITIGTEETKNELLDSLSMHIIQVRFTKLNGDERIMSCTLVPEFISDPVVWSKNPPKRKENPGVISAWDVDKGEWRSFRLDRVISAKVL